MDSQKEDKNRTLLRRLALILRVEQTVIKFHEPEEKRLANFEEFSNHSTFNFLKQKILLFRSLIFALKKKSLLHD